MLNTKRKPSSKLLTQGDDKLSLYIPQLYQTHHSGGDLDNEGSCSYVQAGLIEKISQFCCEAKTNLKIKVYEK